MKEVPAGKKYNGLRGLPTPVRNKMGYMKTGGESLLMKAMGGPIDMVDQIESKVKYGYGREKMKLGGQSGRSVYSGPKKRKKK